MITRYIAYFGKLPLCNKRYERAPHINNFCFPLCWRCTGLILGVILNALFLYRLNMNLQTRFILFTPLLVDSGIQYIGKVYESNNLKRIISGLLCGIALS